MLCNLHVSHVDFTELGKLWPPFVFTLFIWVSFAGSKTSPWRLRIYVNGKANGRFLTMSFGKQWGYKLRKSCCLHTDLSLSATGVEGGQCNPKASVLNIESFSNLKWFGNIERRNASQISKGTSIWCIVLQHVIHSFVVASFVVYFLLQRCNWEWEDSKQVCEVHCRRFGANDWWTFWRKISLRTKTILIHEHMWTPKRNSSKSYSVVLLSSEE